MGGADLQAFTVVTNFGLPHDIHGNTYSSESWNLVALLAVDQGLGLKELVSLKARALRQAEQLRKLEERSKGKLLVVTNRKHVEEIYQDRNDRPVGALLGLEGAHALEGDPEHVKELFGAGFRMMAPTHHFDNRIGGSNTGVNRGGLSVKGRQAVELMLELGIVIDLAHASSKTIDDVIELSSNRPKPVPVVVSHTGFRGLCDKDRNLSDEQIVKIAQTGGVVGVGLWNQALCGKASVEKIVEAIGYARDLLGGRVDNIALGSDFDGAVNAAFDVTGLRLVTKALLDDGSYSRLDIEKIMGRNVYRVLMQSLPG